MNPVLRLVSGHGANATSSEGSGAGEPTPEFVPGFEPRQAGSPASVSAPSSQSSLSSSSSLLQTGHLARCRRCGELNGRSAESCWNCEAELHSGTLPTGMNPGPPSAANSDTPPSSLLPEFPVLTSSVTSSELRASHAAAMPSAVPASSTRRGTAGNLVAMVVVLMVLAGAGTYLYLDSQESDTAAARSAAAARSRAATAVRPAALAAPANPAATVAPPQAQSPSGELSAVDAALRTAELVSQQPKPETMPVYVAPAERVIAASTKTRSATAAAAAGKTRTASRSLAPPTPAAAAAPQVYAPAARVRPPAPAAVPCTPNVAALGLCGAPASSQAKE